MPDMGSLGTETSIVGDEDPESVGPLGDGSGSLGDMGSDPWTPVGTGAKTSATAIPAQTEAKVNPRPLAMAAPITR